MGLIRSVSGIRALVGADLTPNIVARYAAAFASWCEEGTIAIGRDGRQGGEWIAHVVAGAVASAGKTVMDLGVVPTPTVQLFAERPGVSGGISITASHNPAEWNGLKFLGSDGTFLSLEENQKVWESADNASFKSADYISCGEIIPIDGSVEQHADFVLTLPFLQEPLKNLQEKKLRVVIDAVNASGSVAVPFLLRCLGCEVIELYCDETGCFPHTPEPLPEHLTDLCATVKALKADFGVAVDPDADRLVLVDEHGNAVWEEYTITLALKALATFVKDVQQQAVVVNLSTTLAVDKVAAQFGMNVYRAPVGEINVVNEMRLRNAIIGGEGSGGVIVPECHYGRDSLVGIALIACLLGDKPLSEIVADLPKTSMIKKKYAIQADIAALQLSLQGLFPQATIDTRDGIRLSTDSWWIHLRRSNTEPIIRCIAESGSEEETLALLQQVESLILQQ